MTAPQKSGFEVATESLRTVAGRWEEQGVQMGSIVPIVEGIRFNGVEAGDYTHYFLPSYLAFTSMVLARCKDAQLEMQTIGGALRKIADIYEQEERQHIHSMKNLY